MPLGGGLVRSVLASGPRPATFERTATGAIP